MNSNNINEQTINNYSLNTADNSTNTRTSINRDTKNKDNQLIGIGIFGAIVVVIIIVLLIFPIDFWGSIKNFLFVLCAFSNPLIVFLILYFK